MLARGIVFVLVYIDEAHSKRWPVGIDHPDPHAGIGDRIDRARRFLPEFRAPFSMVVDSWSNDFAETFRAWPDRYFHLDPDHRVLHMSTYGRNADALVDVDCLDLIADLCDVPHPLER